MIERFRILVFMRINKINVAANSEFARINGIQLGPTLRSRFNEKHLGYLGKQKVLVHVVNQTDKDKSYHDDRFDTNIYEEIEIFAKTQKRSRVGTNYLYFGGSKISSHCCRFGILRWW